MIFRARAVVAAVAVTSRSSHLAKADLEGKDKPTVPAVKPPSMEMKKEEPPHPCQNLNIPAETLASANLALPGRWRRRRRPTRLVRAPAAARHRHRHRHRLWDTARGLVRDGAAGTGGGAYRPGNGVETPRLLKEVKPQYTAQAMRAKIQGTVLLECVVQPDGSVGNIKVVRSLDPTFGLDQEAVKAARQWQFAPGTRFGQPVPVLVTIEIAFTLR